MVDDGNADRQRRRVAATLVARRAGSLSGDHDSGRSRGCEYFFMCNDIKDEVGSLLGAMTGALIGQKTESGFIRGATIGAISGAVFSLEVYEYSLLLWHTNEPRSTCLLYLMDVLSSLLSGRLVREQVGPAVQSAVQQQMGASDASLDDVFDIYDIGGAKGLSQDLVEKIPKIRITTHKQNSLAHDSSEKTSCAVCLQDLEVGEMVRCLPNCYHMFHLPCIDMWLTKCGSCPLCRGYI
ncbi:hypothetical protein Syun_015156 [Stephania yunnanensis]|uniref:RING-type domain-containing protein n=1 Tax=Stephania yunnanensis TaxID=152371 RepID=A0AAP0JLR1_9MAGN